MNAPFAGRLRHRVRFDRPVYETSKTGGKKFMRWAPAFSCWANVKGVRGEEAVIADQRLSTVTHMIELRFRSDIEDDMSLVVFNSKGVDIRQEKRLDIIDVFDPDGTCERLHAMAEDRGGNA